MCTGCGPFGTVTVSSVAGQPNELNVMLTLDPGEVFASTGAGSALLFDVSGNPTLSVMSLLPAGYSFPNGSGGYFTGDVVTSGPLTPVPLPPALSLLLSALAGLPLVVRGRQNRYAA
jgi:hypothetical protein